MTPEEQVQEIVRRVQAGELSTTDALNGIVVILQQAGVEGTLEQLQRFAQEAFDRVTSSLTATTEPAPQLPLDPAGTGDGTTTDGATSNGGTTTDGAGTPQTIDQIVTAMNAGTLSPFEAQNQLSAILQSQEGLASADAFQRATTFLLSRAIVGSDTFNALFASQGFTGTDRPGG